MEIARFNALLEILRRNNFSLDILSVAIRAIVILGLVILGLLTTLGVCLFYKPDPLVVAATEDGRIIPITPTNEPMYHDGNIARFAADAYMAVTTFGFADYPVRFSEAKQYFSPKGWAAFEKGLDESGNLKTLIKSQLVSTGVFTQPPIVVKQGVDKSTKVYTWVIEFEGVQTFESAIDKYQKQQKVTMQIIRTPITLQSISENKRGLAVNWMTTKSY